MQQLRARELKTTMSSENNAVGTTNHGPEGGDAFLLQKVHSLTDRAVLLRKYVSRKSAGKGRAVLEYLQFERATINMFYAKNPKDEEEAVQAGLLKWAERINATWQVVIDVMEYAGIAVQDINKLKEELQKAMASSGSEDTPSKPEEVPSRPNQKKPAEEPKSHLFKILIICSIAAIIYLPLFTHTVDPPIQHAVDPSKSACDPFKPTVEPVAVFREHLQTKYNMTYAASSLRHLKVPGFAFFQPLIYEAEEVIPERGAVERLQHGKESMAEYNRVMQAASGGKLVLLEGPPGSGKSTVSRQLCRDWAVCVLGTEFELVVLVPLRELRRKETVELEDVLKVAYWDLPDGIVPHIEAVDGKGVLFILDGYDEIKSQTEGVPTVIENLLRRSYLQRSSVIVTSRGSAAKSLYENQYLDKRFIIQGLREDEIPVFVSYYFGESNEMAAEVQSLLDTLVYKPRLASACRNTLTLAIVCYLHSVQESIPTAMTGLYGRFLVISLGEFVKDIPERVELPKVMLKYNMENFVMDLTLLLDPGSPFIHLGAVAELALEGILHDKLIFETSDEIVPQFPDGFDGYGLLDSTAVITDDLGLDTKLYRLNFLHLTVQEFMAALFVASWTPEEQADFWSIHMHLAMPHKGYTVDNERFLTMFTFYCGLTGLQNRWVQNRLLEEVNNYLTPSSQFDQTLVKVCNLAAESGNKEFVSRLLAPLGKTAKVDLLNWLDSTDIAWCLNACNDSFEELVVNYSGNSVHAVAKFLSQLNQLTSLSVLELPFMVCSSELLESTCCEDLHTISRFWRKQTHPKSLKMKCTQSLNHLPLDLLLHIQEITLKDIDLSRNQWVSLLNELPSLRTLVLEDVRLPNASESANTVDPLVIDAVSDAVKRHPKLIEVTVGGGCSESLSRGVVQGVLQKADLQKVDVLKSMTLDHYSKTTAMSPKYAMNDLVQEYLIPAMKRGSLKVLAVRLEKSSSVESIFRELPQSKVEELSIAMEQHYRYSEESHRNLVAATKSGLSESTTLKKFRMESTFKDAFLTECILTNVNRPLEELELRGFDFHPGALADCVDHLRELPLKKLILWDVHQLTPYDIATLLVGGLGQNGTLEELVIKAWYLEKQTFQQDVEDEVTLKAVEAALRESTSIKKIAVNCRYLIWTNVATAILKGSTANNSLRELTLQMLRINVEEWRSIRLPSDCTCQQTSSPPHRR